ncbi:MAG: SpoIID/LytB domain-containing protein [Firmicutes bacterium]|nr:SpoIID/LytB domain-containing protein [Bacillota bacterium]
MQKFIKIPISAIMMFFIIIFVCSKTYAADDKEVRVGLFFRDMSRNLNTEVSFFNIFAEKGLEIGYQKDGKFTTLVEIKDNTKLMVRKDAYFISKNNTLQEYVFDKYNGDDNITEGEKVGPFHVKIGSNYPDYNGVITEVQVIRKKGIDAYPVYNNGTWCIWTGFYTDENSAKKDIDNSLRKNLGDGDYVVVTPNKNNIVVTSGFNETVGVFCNDNGNFQIRPGNNNNPYIFNINGKNYRGILEVRRLENSDMTVINVLPLEHYLYGVVPCEMGWDAHPEALKAQAVAARTYAYNNLGKYSKLGFDLCSTVFSQVYKGFDFEKETTNKAVDDTKGKVIYYDGAIAQVFYFSSSGGRTEAVKNVWSSDIPYLQSVEDKYEEGNSPNYTWEKHLSAASISNIMTSRGNNTGDILGIRITKTSDAGRAIEMVITGTKGENKIEKARCREVLDLPSQWFYITTDADIAVLDDTKKNTIKTQLAGKKVITGGGLSTIEANKNVFLLAAEGKKVEIPSTPEMYTFIGRGYGHAVGMSQEGAKGMAKAGFTYEEILSHYFPGVYIK